MTRVTNFGRKRTYIESGLGADSKAEAESSNTVTALRVLVVPDHATTETDVAPPAKKKRKRTKMSKRDGNTGSIALSEGRQPDPESPEDATAPQSQSPSTSAAAPAAGTKSEAKKKRKQKQREREKRLKAASASASELRRQRRISEKQADTTCFACREKGTPRKIAQTTRGGEGAAKGRKSVVGICYRCGSTKHNLSQCKKPPKDSDPLPFAPSASTCPQNKSKGIYPNGGCCKLCGDTTHLAKDCLRQQDAARDSATILGTGAAAGADEDDFHASKRRTTEVEKYEKRVDRAKRLTDIKAGVHSGIIKPFGKINTTSAAKVVNF
ncbi:hypothetical protein BD779DRAFT_1661061 [Infundibulicybe gibba]|nr:hypothetical protein BD779DRAFT_1661061 [Infundibulicybe gibba]